MRDIITSMCSREEMTAELKKCEDRIMALVHEEIRTLREQAQTAIIDRNSVHMLLEQMQKDNKITHALAEKILEQTTKTNGRVTDLEKWQAVHMEATKSLMENTSWSSDTIKRVAGFIVFGVIGAVLALVINHK